MGGPPQHSTWDPKPDAPPEVRGEFGPIDTNVPGIRVASLLPRTAQLMDKLCVLRAVSTGDNAHSSSGYYMLTGVPHAPMNVENANPGAPNDWPNLGAVVRRLRRRPRRAAGGGAAADAHLQHRPVGLAGPGRRLPRPRVGPVALPLRARRGQLPHPRVHAQLPMSPSSASASAATCSSNSTGRSRRGERHDRGASARARPRRSTC